MTSQMDTTEFTQEMHAQSIGAPTDESMRKACETIAFWLTVHPDIKDITITRESVRE
jgi:hypothetical protein